MTAPLTPLADVPEEEDWSGVPFNVLVIEQHGKREAVDLQLPEEQDVIHPEPRVDPPMAT
jgi:hypothetical protein